MDKVYENTLYSNNLKNIVGFLIHTGKASEEEILQSISGSKALMDGRLIKLAQL